MAYISTDCGFAFFAAPATGSSAVLNALQEAKIGEYWPRADIIEDGRRIVRKKHSTLDDLKAANLDGRIEGLLKVVGTRNIFSFFVAKYLRNKTTRLDNVENEKSWIHRLPEAERIPYIARLRRQSLMSFEEVLRHRFRNQKRGWGNARFYKGMDVFLHQEALAEEFSEFGRRIGLPVAVEIKPYGVTGAMTEHETYKDFYTPELVDLIYDRCGEFFELFPEYSFDGLDRSKVLNPKGV